MHCATAAVDQVRRNEHASLTRQERRRHSRRRATSGCTARRTSPTDTSPASKTARQAS
ncbi:MAG: hypothetical protein IPH72_11705 [Sandaracinaceae bacterium]|nr:hypothetical protein [Sandaracinaceae bacterium]